MKKVTITSMFLILTIFIFGQDWSYDIYRVGEKYLGYIIKNDGTKIEGYLQAHSRASSSPFTADNQTKVTFFSNPKDKKSKIEYKPEDLKEYVIADKHYVTMNYSGGLFSKPLRFLLVQKEGKIKTCIWYEFSTDPATAKSTIIEKTVFQKGDEKPIEMSSFLMGFAKKMTELVQENTELVKKINEKQKGYGALNIENIIAEYNEWFKKNN